MTVQRIDQKLAVAAADALPDPVTPDLKTRYRQLRIMLHSAGLAASYAFIASAANKAGSTAEAYGLVAEGLKKRLTDLRLLTGDPDSLTHVDVLRKLGALDPVQYARASAEAAALVSWLSRLANAVPQPQQGAQGGQDAP